MLPYLNGFQEIKEYGKIKYNQNKKKERKVPREQILRRASTEPETRHSPILQNKKYLERELFVSRSAAKPSRLSSAADQLSKDSAS